MKVTVKEGIKGFSGKLSFGGTASAGTKNRQVQADAVPPYLFGATASAGTKNYSALQRAPVQKNRIIGIYKL
jgi:hypothetical protein